MRSLPAAVLAISTLLSACSDTPRNSCPPLEDYDPPFKTRLASELHQLGEDSAAAKVVEDYAQLREQVKACG
jgi:hypothetical protein